jgi:hypothetical protein
MPIMIRNTKSCQILLPLIALLSASPGRQAACYQPIYLSRQFHGRASILAVDGRPHSRFILAAHGVGDDGIIQALDLVHTGTQIFKEIAESRDLPNDDKVGHQETSQPSHGLVSTRDKTQSPHGRIRTNYTAEALQSLVQDKVDVFHARAKRTRLLLLRKLIAWAYHVCAETKKDGKIDPAALYAGTLLVHLQLSKYLGVAACHPPTRDAVDELFELADQDRSGDLNQQEFTNAVLVACTPISLRVAIYWSLLAVLPMLVSHTMGGILRVVQGHIQNYYLPRASTILLQGTVQYIFSLCFFSLAIPFLFDSVDRVSRRAAQKRCTARGPNQSPFWSWWQPSTASSYLQRVGNSLHYLQDTVFGPFSSSRKKQPPRVHKRSDS